MENLLVVFFALSILVYIKLIIENRKRRQEYQAFLEQIEAIRAILKELENKA